VTKGTLYLCATPIGNLDEVTNRLIETLSSVSLIACEDTRNSKKLLSHFNIHNKTVAYHNFNEKEEANKIIDLLNNGESVAIISDAGYPLISDPGYVLVQQAIDNGITINVISGPNAAVNALVGSGMDTNHYLFYGFLNSKQSEVKKELSSLKDFPYTIIFYEAPHRINRTLLLCKEILGNRKAVIARELTKLHEKYHRGTLDDLSKGEYKGEIVLIVDGKREETKEINLDSLVKDIDRLIKSGLKTKEAITEVAKKNRVSKNDLYNYYHHK